MNKKEEKAFRILEALSEVDEDLLERCNQEKKTADRGKVLFFYQRYGKLCAACLCLVLLGGAYIGLRGAGALPTNTDKSEKMSLMTTIQGQTPEAMEEPADAAEEACRQEKAEENGIAAEGATLEEYLPDSADSWTEPAWMDVPEYSEEARNHSTLTQQTEANSEAEKDGVAWKEKLFDMAGAGRIEEELLPEEYRFVAQTRAADASTEGGVSLLYVSDDKTLWLRIQPTDLSCDLDFGETTVPFVKLRGDWAEEIPAVIPGEPMQLAFLYEDGVLLQYYGELTREQIILLLQGIH